MINPFRKKSRVEILQKRYQKLLKEAYDLSKINRAKSDRKQVEAEEILKEIDALRRA